MAEPLAYFWDAKVGLPLRERRVFDLQGDKRRCKKCIYRQRSVSISMRMMAIAQLAVSVVADWTALPEILHFVKPATQLKHYCDLVCKSLC